MEAICLYFENIFIHGVRAEIEDAVFTFYKISAKMPGDTVKPALYHSHFYYEFHVLLTGQDRYMVQGDAISATAGSLTVIPPYTEHYPVLTGQNAKKIVLGVTLEQKGQETGVFQYFFETLCSAAKKPVTLSEKLLDDITALNDSFDGATLRDICVQKATAYAVITRLFDLLNRFSLPSPVKNTVAKDGNTDINLELMINEVRYSLQDIASSLGYSTRHTSRLILKKYGKSLTEIRQKNILSTAKRLLKSQPALSLEAVAMQSGFAGTDAMARAFGRWENMTPTEYRKGKSQK